MTVKSNAKSTGKPPISRHPLFAVVVALWFAALLGLGSMVVSTSVIENLVLAAHIDSLVPAAAPPLGFTARVLLAGGLALTGAVFGYVLARMVGRKGEQRAESPSTSRASSRAVVAASTSAEDDNDDFARLDAARERTAPRRRALSLEDTAPAVLRIDDLADIDEIAPDTVETTTAPALAEVEVEPEVEVETGAPAPLVIAVAPMVVEPAAAPAPAAPAPHGSLVDHAARIPAAAAETLRAAPVESLGLAQLVDRFALALAARRARALAPPAPQPAHIPPPADPAPTISSEPVTPAPPLPQVAVAQAVPPPFAPPATPALLATPNPDANESEGPRPFDMPPSMREPGLGNIDWFDDVEEEETLRFLLPPKRPSGRDPFAANPPAGDGGDADTQPDAPADAERWALPDAEDPVDEEALPEEVDESPFSSLLAINAGAFVRVDEDQAEADVAEPVVVFPGQATAPQPILARLPGTPFGASPVQTEEALREALAALQKMSGAA
jgi:hypothetical protein